MKTRGNSKSLAGFTLVELMVVLVIISAMVAVVLPFCKRSNDGLQIKQAGSSIAQSIRYAIDLSEKRKRAVEFIYDEKFKSYCLRVDDGEGNFCPLEDFAGTERFLNEGIFLFDIDGFEQTGSQHSLIFDFAKPWPQASITLSTNDLAVTIKIKSKYVEVEEDSV